ncbi:MAG: pyridoxamine 5'-phosphate oxidase, partial [Sphingomonadales bacterium]
MTHKYLSTLFTDDVKAAQAANGSRAGYARFDGPAQADELTEAEADFIAVRDSFYMATVSENGWPYIQHRGG